MDSYVSSDFDILLTDIHEKDIVETICPLFNMKNLQESTCTDFAKIKGFVWGPCSRQVAPVTVGFRGTNKDTIFIIDSGSPQTYLANSVLMAFGLQPFRREKIPMIIHGKELYVDQSHGHFADVSVLGTDFLLQRGALVIADYELGKKEIQLELRH